MIYNQHARYNGKVGLYPGNKIEQFQLSTNGWPGSVIHFDASLSTTSSATYGYNVLSGGYITRMSNLSDPTMSTDATGSASLAGSGSSKNIYLVIPSTLYTTGRAFTSPVTYSTSSTQSTYFIVSNSYTTQQDCFSAIIRSNGAINTSQSITDGTGFLFQSNKSTSTTTGAHAGTQNTGTVYLTTAKGSTTETSNGTVVKANGVTQSYSSGYVLGTPYTQTSLLEYYVTNSPIDTRGKTMSFSELIFFDYLLSDSEFNAVETYLKNKWGISY